MLSQIGAFFFAFWFTVFCGANFYKVRLISLLKIFGHLVGKVHHKDEERDIYWNCEIQDPYVSVSYGGVEEKGLDQAKWVLVMMNEEASTKLVKFMTLQCEIQVLSFNGKVGIYIGVFFINFVWKEYMYFKTCSLQ